MAFLHILVVDDHALVRKNVRSLVERFSKWEVCGEAADGCEEIVGIPLRFDSKPSPLRTESMVAAVV